MRDGGANLTRDVEHPSRAVIDCWLQPPVVSSPRIQGEDVRGTVGTLFDQIRDHFVKGKASSAKNYILNAALVAQNKHAVSVMDKINTSKWVGCECSSSYPVRVGVEG